MVGDRGMITSARITALKDLGGMGWLTALRAPQIAALAADDGPLQMSLFDEQNFAEITHPDYPGERLVACRNPLLAAERARKRTELLAATEAALAPIIAAVAAGRVTGAGPIGVKVGKVLGKFKMAKHFHLDITDTTLTITRDTDRIDTEAALDGIYVLRTTATPGDTRHRRGDRGLQEPRPRRTRLPQPQNHRPRSSPHPPPPRRPRQSPRPDLHARRLPDLASASSIGPADLHRRTPTPTRRPRRPRTPLSRRQPPKPPAKPPPTHSYPPAATKACSHTWPPSPETTCATATTDPSCPP